MGSRSEKHLIPVIERDLLQGQIGIHDTNFDILERKQHKITPRKANNISFKVQYRIKKRIPLRSNKELLNRD